MALPKRRKAKPNKAKGTTRKAPARKSSPRVHENVKLAQGIGLELSPAELHFLENTQNVTAEGNPLQGRPF